MTSLVSGSDGFWDGSEISPRLWLAEERSCDRWEMVVLKWERQTQLSIVAPPSKPTDQYEYPISHRKFIEEAEAPTCRQPRRGGGIRRARSRGSRNRTTKCTTASRPPRWSVFQRYVKTTGRPPYLAAADDTQQNRESTALATAKSALYQVKESPNAYPPLKSLAGCLWYILNNCEVWSPSCIFATQCLWLL